MVSPDRLEVVRSPVREGTYALKTRVAQGDNPIGASGNRNELVYLSHEPPGSEFYYRWSTMFDDSFPSAETWQVFTDWHHEGCCGSAPIEFYVLGEEIRLQAGGNTVWSTPLVRGRWIDFVFHVKWSNDPLEGFVELYRNSERVLPKTPVPTMYPGMQNYLKQGLYRDSAISADGIVYHDAMVQATTLEDVLPPDSPAPDSGVSPLPSPPDGGAPGPSGATTIATFDLPPVAESHLEAQAGCSASSGFELGAIAGVAMIALRRQRLRNAQWNPEG